MDTFHASIKIFIFVTQKTIANLLCLVYFDLHVRARETADKEPGYTISRFIIFATSEKFNYYTFIKHRLDCVHVLTAVCAHRTRVEYWLITKFHNGLIRYPDPISFSDHEGVTDFLALINLLT